MRRSVANRLFRTSLRRLSARGVAGALLAVALLSGKALRADEFPEIFNNERANDDEPMPAEQAAGSMVLPDGFRATVFASEPQVQNPIAMAWDERGRMWVAENYTYSDRTQHFDLSLRDRVVIFHDEDGDGRADSRKVFTDQVQMLTSVEVGRGGVWLMCPPKLLFIPDADGDDVADGPPQVVLDGFTVSDSNYHNFANGLRWGPDGWLYGRCGHSCPGKIGVPGTPDEKRVPIEGGIWRFHPERKTVEVLCHGTVNPWGHDWDRNGELFFINTVIGHLWHCMPGAHFIESFGESPNPLVFHRLDMIADHYHYDRNGSWQASRDGAANEFGGGHAHIGMMIYQSQRWPQRYRNRLFTLNMHGLRANVETIKRQGAGYTASHEPDFMLASDPFFRGIEISTGPDGQAYVIDWSDTGECHDHTGVHRTSGRIYKISYENTPGETATGEDAAIGSTVMGEPFSKPACLAGDGKLPKLWRDYQADRVTQQQLLTRLGDPDEHVRTWAIRLLSDHWPLDTMMGPPASADYPDQPNVRAAFVELARREPSGLVLLALASTLQRLPPKYRAELAAELVQHESFAGDRDLPAMVWYGLMPLVDHNPHDLIEVAAKSTWPRLLEWITRGVAGVAESDPEPLDRLLNVSMNMPTDRKRRVLVGMSDAFRGWLKAPMPAAWIPFSKSRFGDQYDSTVRELNVLFGSGRAMEELTAIVSSGDAPLKLRRQALSTLIDARPDNLRAVCEQALNDRGLAGVAARGLALFADPEIGKALASKYRRFHPDDRTALIELLVSRPVFAHALLDQLEADRNLIPQDAVTAFHARQILGHGDDALTSKLERVWGILRESSSESRAAIESLKSKLTPAVLAKANLRSGRQLFQKTCAQCHRLFGDGESIGPDLTGAQRSNLDYLLENILAPSAVVGKDHRMSIVLTEDGRVLNGLVVSRNEKTLGIQTQSRKETLPVESIVRVKETTLSPMPDGLLTNLDEGDVRDLIAYLMNPVQVALD